MQDRAKHWHRGVTATPGTPQPPQIQLRAALQDRNTGKRIRGQGRRYRAVLGGGRERWMAAGQGQGQGRGCRIPAAARSRLCCHLPPPEPRGLRAGLGAGPCSGEPKISRAEPERGWELAAGALGFLSNLCSCSLQHQRRDSSGNAVLIPGEEEERMRGNIRSAPHFIKVLLAERPPRAPGRVSLGHRHPLTAAVALPELCEARDPAGTCRHLPPFPPCSILSFGGAGQPCPSARHIWQGTSGWDIPPKPPWLC